VNRLRHNPRAVTLVASLLLMVPVFTGPGVKPGWPRAWEGDEPHYVVMLHSLINDHDLNVRNNYWRAHQGELDAGRTMAASPLLDHQSAFWVGPSRVEWCQVYACQPEAWRRNADGSVTPHLLAGKVEPLVPEVPSHPAGLPLALAAVLWPLAGTTLVEPAAVVCMGLMMVAALWLFTRLLRGLGAPAWQAAWLGAVAFLCTPVWHYSRSLFNEGALLLTLLWACVVTVERRHGAWAGAGLGLGIIMKPPWALLAIPLWWDTLKHHSRRNALAFAAAGTVAVAAVLGLNALICGGPLRTAQPFVVGNPLNGLVGLLLDPRHGLLPTAPILGMAFWGWRVQHHHRQSRMLLAVALTWLLFMAAWWAWDGAWCFGPRMMVPLIPLFMVGMLAWRLDTRPQRVLAGTLLALGFVFNAVGALFYHRAYGRHPLEVVWSYLGPR
jgi:hypothetical protein